MTRAEHLQWAKDRAHAYVDTGELDEAVASMVSDLTKHPETNGLTLPHLAVVGAGLADGDDARGVRTWIDGFR